MKKNGAKTDDEIDVAALAKEMEAVKRLLVLLLAKLGSGSKQIAMALGVDDSTIRKMISMRKDSKLTVPQSDK